MRRKGLMRKDGAGDPAVRPVEVAPWCIFRSVSRGGYYRNQEVVADMVNKSAHNKRPHDATSSEVQELAN